MVRLKRIEIEQEERVGEGGFLTIRRFLLRNRREDGSASPPYSCDMLDRPLGLDAVTVAVFTRARGRREVLLRDGLRLPLVLGRQGGAIPVPDRGPYLLFTEAVAGVIERDDVGEQGVRRRAALEVMEEAGYQVAADQVLLLGAGVFPVPGMLAEKVWMAAVEVPDPDRQAPLAGDGSPMEEGALTRWMELDAAIAACVAGTIEDMKTELVLRRLRDHLGA
jgi:ADP-ribose pyrophosphatase